ncbi:MAG: hypothetical protein A3F17_01615 [Gammaproteobacteria bacterium RIFCSPHIGHO2_12_FULL_41_15]|nr:MAG: hypothetical protein A3F17_01615 [Gammaproteobacteria bacterium RIFCSPHIGHO2_12_FULL_41_15]
MDTQQLLQFAKTDQRVPLILTCLLILLTMTVFVSNVSYLIALPTPQLTATLTQPIQPTTTRIANWHLFGDYQASLANLPATQLQLTLHGTDVADAYSSALIGDMNNNNQKYYRLGDRVPGGATLYKVFPHYVILNHNGTFEILKLPLPTISNLTN